MKNKKRMITLTAAAALSIAVLSGCTNERLEEELSYRQLGIASMQKGDYEEAIAAFDSALSHCDGKISGTELDICYYKAAALYASGDAEGALDTYNALLAYDKKDANAYYLRGCLLLKNGDLEGARADFANAVTYNASDIELYINIYQNLAANNLSAEGEEYLNKVFSIKGNDAASLAGRGKVYYLLGENQNALTELEAAIDAGSVDANLTIAQVYETLGDGAAAETYYKAYLDSGAADASAMCALAELEMAKQNYEAALSYVNQGLAMDEIPNRRQLMQNQIICLEYTGDFDGAWNVMEEYMSLYPDDMEALREYIFLKNRYNVEAQATQEIQAEIIPSTEEAQTTESGE
ncbi:MAG: tetratricopeptide repeat protein [Roseburia sp.]|nr:tetratricopeptide repeat protein [Roseburia sp.]